MENHLKKSNNINFYLLSLCYLLLLLFSISCTQQNKSITSSNKEINNDSSLSIKNQKLNSGNLIDRKNLDKYRVTLYKDTVKKKDINANFWNIYLLIEDTLENKVTFNYNCFTSSIREDSSVWRIDLNSDGKNEVLVFGSPGASSYLSEECLILDFTLKPEPILAVASNSVEVKKINGENLIKVVYRNSPSVNETGYIYFLKYGDGKFKYKFIIGETKPYCLCMSHNKSVEDPEECIKTLTQKEICNESRNLDILFVYLLDKTLMNQKETGWQMFDKKYNCKDKQERKNELKEEIEDEIKTIMHGTDGNEYKFVRRD